MYSSTSRLSLLIIQSNKRYDDHVKKYLEEKNCQAEETDTPDKGIRMIRNLSFDSVILDLEASRDDDHLLQLIAFAKEYEQVPPLILIGDPHQKSTIEKKLNYQIYEYLIRPLSNFDLDKIIRHLIDRKSILEKNLILKERLKNSEDRINRLFTRLEDKVMKNTREIAEKKDVLQKIFNQLDGDIILVDKNYHIIQANSILSRSVKTASDQLGEGQYLRYLSAMDLQNNHEDSPGYKAINTGKAVSVEKTIIENKDHHKIIRQTAFPILDHRQEIWGFVQFNQDVTEERMEQNRRIQLEKVRVIETLAGFLSCNLKSLSLAIHDTIKNLGKKINNNNNNDLKNLLHVVENQALLADEYLPDLLLILNKSHVDTALINLNDLLQATLSADNLTPRSERIKVTVELEKNLPFVRVNRSQMVRIFIHLITNAFESMPQGGELKIMTREKAAEVEIQFTDNGVGIPEDIRPKIFEPFFTTKVKKLGLGLYICKSILEKYKGRLILQNKTPDQTSPNQTTSFIITLPLSHDCESCKR